ncbi:hypothetical protein CY35_18G091100 [Sphagnum magellanicum]|nr:hypothetical protein CY35_18G091100 [Sphagnum magellanicum]
MDSLHEANSEYVSKDEESGDDTSSRNLRVNVDTGDSTFEVVEKTNWNEGTWSDTKSTRYTLTVNGSDVAGILRFMGPPPNGSKDSEFFLVAVGNDTAPWCDLKVNLGPADTGDMNFDAINDQLIVGSHPSNALDIVKLYKKNGVRAIVNLQRSEERDRGDIDAITEQCALIGDRIWYQRVPIQDGSKKSVRNNLPEAVGILNRAIQERAREHGETVYLHCCRGHYRAPTVAVAYLFWFAGMSLQNAVKCVETARKNSHPFENVIQEVTDKILGRPNDGDLTAVQRDLIQRYVTQLRRVRNA